MSTRVYLTDEVTKLEGFNRVGYPPISISDDGGRWYIHLNQNSPIPQVLAEVVDEVSIFETIPAHPSRERGVYNLESARATVDVGYYGDLGGMMTYEVIITAKTLEDARELLERIKIGNIHRPDVSYDAPQSGKSRQELEVELEETNRVLAAMETEVDRVRRIANDLMSLKADLRSFYRDLERRWPFCTTGRVEREISAILNNFGV